MKQSLHKKGMGIIGFIFMWFIVLAIYVLALASIVNEQANIALQDSARMDGIEIFFWSNIQLFFALGFLLAIVAGVYYLGGAQ